MSLASTAGGYRRTPSAVVDRLPSLFITCVICVYLLSLYQSLLLNHVLYLYCRFSTLISRIVAGRCVIFSLACGNLVIFTACLFTVISTQICSTCHLFKANWDNFLKSDRSITGVASSLIQRKGNLIPCFPSHSLHFLIEHSKAVG